MIIVNLKGGLGNQMFQYACGRALSFRSNNRPLKLDMLGLEKANNIGDTYRPYALKYFTIQEDVATEAEIQKIKYPFGILSKCNRYIGVKVLRKFYTKFVPNVLSLSGDVYLDGYFQSEQYFQDVSDEIRKDFSLSVELGVEALEIAKDIQQNPTAVAIHIRRKDYLGHPELEMKDKTYYERAMEYVRKNIDNPRWYIFSDDIDWARAQEEFLEDAKFISSPRLMDYEELILMSKCQHNIIANSSFSWWGAWLNQNPNKIVIAPKQWVSGKRNNTAFKDIVPPDWIRL